MASKSLKSLTFDIFGRDRSASRTMNSIGANAAAAGKKVALAAAAIAAAVAVVVVRFGIDSVKAAAAAETEQLKLTAAWAKFPKTADLAIDALRDYNSELAKKTKFDDEAIGSGQAVLAQFKLTGKQIQKLTPLLLDYAARTGKDLPTAAQDLGKALLGQGRALKAIGINFKDTGSEAGNFTALVAALSSQVGGFAEKEGTTAAGKLAILQNRFGEVQEAIGVALMPTLSDLLDFTNQTVLPGLEKFSGWFTSTGLPAIKDFVGWVVQYKDILGPAAVAIGAVTVAQWALNAAMFANPVGLITLGVIALIGYLAALATNFMGVRTNILNLHFTVAKAFSGLGASVAMGLQGAVNAVIGGINAMLGPLNSLMKVLGINLALRLPNATFGNAAKQNYGNLVAAIGVANGGGSQTPAAGSTFGRFGGQAAEGGIIPARPGGWMINAGEGGESEVIIPLSKLGGGLGGDTYVINVPGYISSDDKSIRKLAQAVLDAKKRGMPRTAFGG